jgi:hypothetical protein
MDPRIGMNRLEKRKHCGLYQESHYKLHTVSLLYQSLAVPWLMWLVADLSPQTPWFDLRPDFYSGQSGTETYFLGVL